MGNVVCTQTKCERCPATITREGSKEFLPVRWADLRMTYSVDSHKSDFNQVICPKCAKLIEGKPVRKPRKDKGTHKKTAEQIATEVVVIN